MGIKHLWNIFNPFADRKPLSELRGKTVAIDLAGWVCASLKVVDYSVHSRQHLKNLFFRTCYLIWEDVTPVFVLEGSTLILKTRAQIDKRGKQVNSKHGERSRFNVLLKECENLLKIMGIECVTGPDEAEAFCAFLNKKNLVDGVISQDSDCFAYGALRVYRNFSVSSQRSQATSGGSVEIYDMEKIAKETGFGQNKIIAVALFCGCDYGPQGVCGIGHSTVSKLLSIHNEKEILDKIRLWRKEESKYAALEKLVNDKRICDNCGHIGRTQFHATSGCEICHTYRGCNKSVWKEERLAIKAELIIRKKALMNPEFPCEQIIHEFLKEPEVVPVISITWKQPNMFEFVKEMSKTFQWTELVCFKKFLPIMTRWQIYNIGRYKELSGPSYIQLKQIVKQSTVKGILYLQILWYDNDKFFEKLIPSEQLQSLGSESDLKLQELWTTVEPLAEFKKAYPIHVEEFLSSQKNAQKKTNMIESNGKITIISATLKNKQNECLILNQIQKKKNIVQSQNVKTKKRKSNTRKKLYDKPSADLSQPTNSEYSTPINKSFPSDSESDNEMIVSNSSDIIKDIVSQPIEREIVTYNNRNLNFDDFRAEFFERSLIFESRDDLDLSLILQKQKVSNFADLSETRTRKKSFDDNFYVGRKYTNNVNLSREFTKLEDLMSDYSNFSIPQAQFNNSMQEKNMSYFFAVDMTYSDNSTVEDAFESIMESHFSI